jgi:predicted outer membrane repeat protein
VITCCGATASGKAAGGAYVHGGGKVLDCVIENCTATTGEGAAGVFLNNSSKAPTIERSVIRNCSATDCADTCSGGIASYGSRGGSERIVDCVVSNCTTTARGGGAFLSLGPSASVSGTTFALCHALRGGGVLVADGTCVFEDCSFNGNSSNAGDNGGGVLSTGRASFKNCRFTGNVAGKGGAVYSTSQARTSVTGCDFSSNSADDGGAFYLTGLASASLSNCIFALNRSGYGGAAAFEQDEGGYFAFTNCVFASNAATKYGGAVSCCRSNYSPSGSDGSNPKGMYGEFYGCTFTNNVASDCGGALFHRENNSSRNSGTPLILRNSLFAYNRVSNSGYYHCGGAIYLLSYDKPVVDACTITRNDVTSGGSNQFGAGFYNRFSCSIINTIIADNTMNGVSEGANDWFRSGAAVTASHSCAYPAPYPYNQFTVANGCVTTDPKFADSGKGDFTLRSSSPCKDTALIEPWMANAFDLAGNARVIGNGPNMGCYESVFFKGLVIVVK